MVDSLTHLSPALAMHDHECWTGHGIVHKQYESILHATCLLAANYLKELGFVRMQDSNFWKGCIQSSTNCIHYCHTYTRLQNARLRAGEDYRGFGYVKGVLSN